MKESNFIKKRDRKIIINIQGNNQDNEKRTKENEKIESLKILVDTLKERYKQENDWKLSLEKKAVTLFSAIGIILPLTVPLLALFNTYIPDLLSQSNEVVTVFLLSSVFIYLMSIVFLIIALVFLIIAFREVGYAEPDTSSLIEYHKKILPMDIMNFYDQEIADYTKSIESYRKIHAYKAKFLKLGRIYFVIAIALLIVVLIIIGSTMLCQFLGQNSLDSTTIQSIILNIFIN